MFLRQRISRFLLSLACLWSCNFTTIQYTNAYRVGDVVDTAMYTQAFPVDLLMANMPLFGLARKVKIPRTAQRFSLAFEEGLHSLPYLDGQRMETLKVTFIYSRSGEGRIHSVNYQVLGSNRAINAKIPIDVEFEWIEEEAVNLDAGLSVMFAATLVASVVFLIQLCSVGDNTNGGGHHHNQDVEYRKKKKGTTASVSMGYSNHRGKYSYE
jgi:hypothetical protein